MISGLPFDDIRNLLRQLPAPGGPDAARVTEAATRYAEVASPLGRAADIAAWLSAAGERAPRVLRPVVALFAGTHLRGGVANTAEVQAHVDRAAAGGGAVNQACAAGDVGLKIFDLALDVPVDDMAAAPALDEKACAATIAFGMEAVAGGTDLLVLCGQGGDAGAQSAEVLLAALGYGDHALLSAPAAAALAFHRGHLADPLEALRRLGGREIAALAGAVVAARIERVPVLLDGRAALAAAAVVERAAPGGAAHCRLVDGGGDPVADPVADRAASAMGLAPVLALGMGGADGAAGALAASLAKAAALMLAGAEEFLRRGGDARP